MEVSMPATVTAGDTYGAPEPSAVGIVLVPGTANRARRGDAPLLPVADVDKLPVIVMEAAPAGTSAT